MRASGSLNAVHEEQDTTESTSQSTITAAEEDPCWLFPNFCKESTGMMARDDDEDEEDDEDDDDDSAAAFSRSVLHSSQDVNAG